MEISATALEAKQNLSCGYLAATVLIGFAGNAIGARGGSTPPVGLLIAGLAIYEGRKSW